MMSYQPPPINQRVCRVCFEKTEDRSALISPCQCKGSSLYIHIHCLEIWQQICLQSNLPQKAENCPICKTAFLYPSKIVRFYRRTMYSISNSWTFVTTLVSLLWISFIIVPLKVVLYTMLVLVTIPYGQLSLLGNTAVAWIGYEFPPQLALIYTYPVELLTRNTWPLPTNSSTVRGLRRSGTSSSLSLSLLSSSYSALQQSVLSLSSGIVLVASRNISPSSMFYRAVILLLDYNPSVGSRGVIINFDTSSSSTSSSTSKSILPKIPAMRRGIGGPMETDVFTVLHTYTDCARYSEKMTIPQAEEEVEAINHQAQRSEKRKSFFVAESQYAYRTLAKIASIIHNNNHDRCSSSNDKGKETKISLNSSISLSSSRAFLSISNNVRGKLEKAKAFLRPFPFFSSQEEKKETEENEVEEEIEGKDRMIVDHDRKKSEVNNKDMGGDNNHNSKTQREETIETDRNLASDDCDHHEFPIFPPPNRNVDKNQPQHRFFKNPNYRELSVEARGKLSPVHVRIEEDILCEVKEQVAETNRQQGGVMRQRDIQHSRTTRSKGDMNLLKLSADSRDSKDVGKDVIVERSWTIDDEERYFLIEEEYEEENSSFNANANRIPANPDSDQNKTPAGKEGEGDTTIRPSTLIDPKQRVVAIHGNCIWLANQLEGEIMHGFWHVLQSYDFEDIFPENEEDTRNLWNQMIGKIEENQSNHSPLSR